MGSQFFNPRKIPIVAVAVFCGGIIAIVNYYSNGATIGTGYQQTEAILQGTQTMGTAFPLYKMIATWATFFSGIFVPSLATGAGIGFDLGTWVPITPMSVMILLSMTAYFSGMLQSPLTSFVIVMEMTNSHETLIALMATAFIEAGVSKIIHPKPLYLALCEAYKPVLNINKTG